MPVLKVKKNGNWESVLSRIECEPDEEIINIPFSDSNPEMDGVSSAGIAETVSRSDHRHPTDTTRASSEDVTKLQELVGETSVSEQIQEALGSLPSFKTLSEHLTEEDMILSPRQYGDKLPGEDGEPYTHVAGRIFFLRA